MLHTVVPTAAIFGDEGAKEVVDGWMGGWYVGADSLWGRTKLNLQDSKVEK